MRTNFNLNKVNTSLAYTEHRCVEGSFFTYRYRTLESFYSQEPCEHVFLLIRDRKGALKPEVPCLANLSALQAQFEWLVEENITEAVEANLSIELHNLDLYLR
jgi:hypothetical protein